jgi:hypothetical protein
LGFYQTVCYETNKLSHLIFFLVTNPAVRRIFCGKPHHKRMPLPSGLGDSVSEEEICEYLQNTTPQSCHFDEGEISRGIPQRESPIFVEFLV